MLEELVSVETPKEELVWDVVNADEVPADEMSLLETLFIAEDVVVTPIEELLRVTLSEEVPTLEVPLLDAMLIVEDMVPVSIEEVLEVTLAKVEL